MSVRNFGLLMAGLVAVGAATPASAQISCDRDAVMNRTNVGTVLGAAGGALLGNQFGKGSGKTAMTIAGLVGGGFLGNRVGSNMDQADQACTSRALESARTGQTVSWRNPDAETDYQVTPTRSYRDPQTRRICKDVKTEAVIRGRTELVTGTACKRRDGSWEFID